MAKDIVKIKGTVTERATLNNRKNLLILADDDARLTPTQDGAALDIRGDSTVVIYDLDISHMAGGNPKTGISVSDTAQVELIRVSLVSNTADGAQIADNGKLSCTRCTIAQNTGRGIFMSDGDLTISRSEIKGNAGGGIFVPADGTFQIVGNIIFGNGGGSAQAGGIHIGASPGDGTSRIDFNSISRNNANAAFAPGIDCVSTGTPITAKFNVVWDNGASPFSANQVNVAGCAHVSSDIGPFPTPPALTNFNSDPGFLDEANGNLHLKSDSSVLHKAPAPDLTGLAAIDIDGDMRLTPVDLGADQVTKP
ncbi:MAG TPA: right-handed parallel beta-helix repeat-containing protein [Kofleriaceae bacterium]|nr:right-handed parallel beta-helix repeat-containing protein [Kofleriaceae bacterium]